MPLCLQLRLNDVKLPLRFVKLLTESIQLVLLGLELDPVAGFDVFLDLHTHDVGVDG